MLYSRYILREISSAQASTSSVLCCHFSSDGKLIAIGGHDKKVFLWNADTLKQKSILEEHSLLIADVCFSPSTPRLGTSSFDKTVRVWDADNAANCSMDDLICSCDGDNEMRFWSIKHGNVIGYFKGGSTQLRFEPRYGVYLATASDNVVSILDVETQTCTRRFKSHTKDVDSVWWDPTGEYVVSVSEDTVKVCSLNDESFVNELNWRFYELLKRVSSEDSEEADEDKGHSASVVMHFAGLVKRVPSEDNDESDGSKRHSALTMRRSAWLVMNQSKSNLVFVESVTVRMRVAMRE